MKKKRLKLSGLLIILLFIFVIALLFLIIKNNNKTDENKKLEVKKDIKTVNKKIKEDNTDDIDAPVGDASHPYYVKVIRNMNVVLVYELDSNNKYSKLVKNYTVSVGKDNGTPTGTFKTSDKYEWRALYGGVYGQYATRITDHILFHSVPYERQSKDSLEYDEYNKLGEAASLGCIRMRIEDLKWIYDNLPEGTTVEIYDGELPKGIKKKEYEKIDINSLNRGWDPTDPDPNNPWKK